MSVASWSESRRGTIHVIVRCSNQMSLPISGPLQLGQVSGNSPAVRAYRWIARLSRAQNVLQTSARDLFAGEHWSVARKLPALHRPGEVIHEWVCSAGYGLIPVDSTIMPYHATLTPGQADSVPGTAASWWSALSEWEGPAPGQPRSIRELVAADSTALFMFILSKAYLRMCGVDITAATKHLKDPNRLFIVSAGTKPQGDLASFLVPSDARLQGRLGGTRRALNARIGAHLLSTGVRGRDEATGDLERLLAAQPPIPRYNREKQSDQEVLGFIARRLAQAPATSASQLLREFRDAGFACEQHRFSRLCRTLLPEKMA
jgi:hypothetical protein